MTSASRLPMHSSGAGRAWSLARARTTRASRLSRNSAVPVAQQQAHAQMDPEVLAKIIAVHPIGRFGEPHEIGNVVAWLCSEEAGFITCACINIDGGAGAT